MMDSYCSSLETQYCLNFQIRAKSGLGQGCQVSGVSVQVSEIGEVSGLLKVSDFMSPIDSKEEFS